MHFAAATDLILTTEYCFRLAGDGAGIATRAVVQVDGHAPGIVQIVFLIPSHTLRLMAPFLWRLFAFGGTFRFFTQVLFEIFDTEDVPILLTGSIL